MTLSAFPCMAKIASVQISAIPTPTRGTRAPTRLRKEISAISVIATAAMGTVRIRSARSARLISAFTKAVPVIQTSASPRSSSAISEICRSMPRERNSRSLMSIR
jgi:hypothetical protein